MAANANKGAKNLVRYVLRSTASKTSELLTKENLDLHNALQILEARLRGCDNLGTAPEVIPHDPPKPEILEETTPKKAKIEPTKPDAIIASVPKAVEKKEPIKSENTSSKTKKPSPTHKEPKVQKVQNKPPIKPAPILISRQYILKQYIEKLCSADWSLPTVDVKTRIDTKSGVIFGFTKSLLPVAKVQQWAELIQPTLTNELEELLESYDFTDATAEFGKWYLRNPIHFVNLLLADKFLTKAPKNRFVKFEYSPENISKRLVVSEIKTLNVLKKRPVASWSCTVTQEKLNVRKKPTWDITKEACSLEMAKLFACNAILDIIVTHNLTIPGLWHKDLEGSIKEVDSIELECQDLAQNSGYPTCRAANDAFEKFRGEEAFPAPSFTYESFFVKCTIEFWKGADETSGLKLYEASFMALNQTDALSLAKWVAVRQLVSDGFIAPQKGAVVTPHPELEITPLIKTQEPFTGDFWKEVTGKNCPIAWLQANKAKINDSGIDFHYTVPENEDALRKNKNEFYRHVFLHDGTDFEHYLAECYSPMLAKKHVAAAAVQFIRGKKVFSKAKNYPAHLDKYEAHLHEFQRLTDHSSGYDLKSGNQALESFIALNNLNLDRSSTTKTVDGLVQHSAVIICNRIQYKATSIDLTERLASAMAKLQLVCLLVSDKLMPRAAA